MNGEKGNNTNREQKNRNISEYGRFEVCVVQMCMKHVSGKKKTDVSEQSHTESHHSHQDGSENGGADAICHLEFSFFIGPSEVVFPPRTEHPGRKQEKTVSTVFSLPEFTKNEANQRCSPL